MANKVLKIGSGSSSSAESLEVYRDFNMKAEKKAEGKFQLKKLVNAKAVKNAIHNIFTWIPGERILNPEFGSKLYRYLYEGITSQNVEQIMAEINHCISQFEPRAQVEKVVNVGTIDDTEDNTVHLEIVYSIPSLSPEQYVYSIEYEKSVG